MTRASNLLSVQQLVQRMHLSFVRAKLNAMAAIYAIGSEEKPVPALSSKFSEAAMDFVAKCLTRCVIARCTRVTFLRCDSLLVELVLCMYDCAEKGSGRWSIVAFVRFSLIVASTRWILH